jgi:hypothetical protein
MSRDVIVIVIAITYFTIERIITGTRIFGIQVFFERKPEVPAR